MLTILLWAVGIATLILHVPIKTKPSKVDDEIQYIYLKLLPKNELCQMNRLTIYYPFT